MAIVMQLFAERSEGVEVYFDHVFSRPVTGTPEMDGFNSGPSALLVEAVRGLKPGTALDAGMGQGRNAVYLAREGWEVTGFDISGQALAVARTNAEKAGVRMNAVKAGYDQFDFGVEKWDLIVLAFAWAPVSDPLFVGRIRTSLRPGGRVVFEHMIKNEEGPEAKIVRRLLPGQLKTCFSDFEIVRYEETEGIGDWGGPGSQLVRMVARKR
jgi:2-polyprenyl-3-methyl-5-hydroxy-6-metoxy-1,4-benzoquinol methylase